VGLLWGAPLGPPSIFSKNFWTKRSYQYWSHSPPYVTVGELTLKWYFKVNSRESFELFGLIFASFLIWVWWLHLQSIYYMLWKCNHKHVLKNWQNLNANNSKISLNSSIRKSVQNVIKRTLNNFGEVEAEAEIICERICAQFRNITENTQDRLV